MLAVFSLMAAIAAMSGIAMLDIGTDDSDNDTPPPEEETEGEDIDPNSMHSATDDSGESHDSPAEEEDDAEDEDPEGEDIDGETVELEEWDPEDFPGPLEDWSQSVSVAEVSADEDETLTFDMPDTENGTLHVIEANYVEQDSSEDTSVVHEFSGYHVYFVPEGSTFPEEYEWSSTGAALYNSDDPGDTENDQDIRMLSRISTGQLVIEQDQDGETDVIFDNRQGLPTLESNLAITYGFD